MAKKEDKMSKGLISFVEDKYSEVLRKNNLSVEEALRDKNLRPLLDDMYKKHVRETREQQVEKGVMAMTELLKGELGITPEDEDKVTVSDWITSFVQGKTSELPAPNFNSAEEHLCGLPNSVPCCNKQHKVEKYSIYEGAIYGVCNNAVGVYLKLSRGNTWQSSRLLKFSTDLEMLSNVLSLQKKFKPLRDWLSQFEYGKGELPVSNINQDGEHRCGLPESVPCCDKQSSVSRFASYKGTVYGICQTAGSEYFERVKRAGENVPEAFKTTPDKEKAEGVAKTQRRWVQVHSYVQQLGSGLVSERRPVEDLGEDGKYRCGLPQDVPCCDKQEPVEAYANYEGELYGICGYAGFVYIKAQGRYPRGSAPKVLLFTKKFEVAQRHANGSVSNGNDHQYPTSTKSKGPVGSQTPPMSEEEREVKKEAKKKLRKDLTDRLLKAGVSKNMVGNFVRSIEKKMRKKEIVEPSEAIREYAVCRVLDDSSRRESSLQLAAAANLSSEEFDQLVEDRKVAEVKKSKEVSEKAAKTIANIPMVGKTRVGKKGKSNGKGEGKR